MIKKLIKKHKNNKLNIFDDNKHIQENDIFLVSYPKSGNTWLRFLIGNYLSNGHCNFNNSHLIVPDIHFNPSQINILEGQRFIKSHSPYTRNYQKVIYLVRDGRDVAVSYYFHSKKFNIIPLEMEFSEFIELFNRGKIDNFSTWNTHVMGWYNNISDNSILIKYEELKNNTLDCLRQVIEFSGAIFNKPLGEKSIECSSIKNMKKQEDREYKTSPCLQTSYKDIRFIRNGETQEWKKYFSDKLLNDFLEVHGDALNNLDYL